MRRSGTFAFHAVPPSPPEIRDSAGFLLEETVGPYNEGESLTITCSTSTGECNAFFLDLEQLVKNRELTSCLAYTYARIESGFKVDEKPT